MTLTKAQIAELIAEQNGFARNKSIEIIKHTLESGEDVLVSGFGKFCVRQKVSAAAAIRPAAPI